MNKVLTKHPAWAITEKKKFDRDSSMFVTVTRLRERKGNYLAFIKRAKAQIDKNMPSAKVTGGTVSFYQNVPMIRIYFDSNDASTVDKLVEFIDDNRYDLEIVDIRTPRDEKHIAVLNNKEVTQIVREKLFYDQYRYAAKVEMETIGFASYAAQMDAIREANRYMYKNFTDWRYSNGYGCEFTIHMNNLEELMLFRMTFDIASVNVREVVLISEIPQENE